MRQLFNAVLMTISSGFAVLDMSKGQYFYAGLMIGTAIWCLVDYIQER